MSRKRNLSAKVDIKSNRLLLTYKGKVSKKELDSFYTDLRFFVADLQENFDVIVDYSDCKLFPLNTIPTFKKITYFLITSGLRSIVRIMPQSSFFLRQLLNMTIRLQGYNPIYVKNMEEAEAKLEKTSERKSIRFLLYKHPISCVVNDTTINGVISDISSGGCAIETPEEIPELGTPIVIKFSLLNKENETENFELDGEVVRVREQVFGAKYTDIDDEQKAHLLELLTLASQSEVVPH